MGLRLGLGPGLGLELGLRLGLNPKYMAWHGMAWRGMARCIYNSLSLPDLSPTSFIVVLWLGDGIEWIVATPKGHVRYWERVKVRVRLWWQ